jgi:AAA family ATP:ADP antiporter
MRDDALEDTGPTLASKKRDIGSIILLFLFFFLIISCFWSLKPLRQSSVVKAFGPQYYPLFKQGFLFLVPFVIGFYSMVTCFASRGGLVYFFTSIFIAATVLFWALFNWAPSAGAKIAFFFYIDAFITVMVAIYWTYMNDTFHSEEAKKLYGIIGSGGVLGGITGSAISGTMSVTLGPHIILVAASFLVFILLVVYLLERKKAGNPSSDPGGSRALCPHGDKKVGQVVTEGVSLVMKSRYLLYVVAIVGTYEIVSTVVDYQFNASSDAVFSSVEEMAQFQGRVFFFANVAAFFIMALLTPLVHRRLGILAGLLFLPAALALGSVGFFVWPVLMVVAALIAMEAAFAYSINQASKEILYVPLDRVSKYKGKAFIDMFVFRFGKALGAVLVLSYTLWLADIGFSHRFLMGANFLLLSVWLLSVVGAGRYFKKLSGSRVER